MKNEIDIVSDGMIKEPVDITGIIRNLGIAYKNPPMPDGESGLIEHSDGAFTISVNATEGRQRQRFTAAHELAHYLLHRNMLVEKGGLNRHSDSLFDEYAETNPFKPFNPKHEVEANKLAAAILMPAKNLKNKYDSDANNIAELARDYDVSFTAMRIRLEYLGLLNR